MTLDVEALVRRLMETERAALGAPLPVVDARARALAQYAALVADAHALGDLREEDLRRELGEIAEMTRRYARGIRGLPGNRAERAARAALQVVFDAMAAAPAERKSEPLPMAA